MAPPPLIGGRLRPALRRVLPDLLAAEQRTVEMTPYRPDRLQTAPAGEVGPVDVVAIAEERVQAEHLSVLVLTGLRLGRGEPEVNAIRPAAPGVPGDLPAHALPVPLELLDGSAGGEREAGVARMQVGRVGELIDDHRASVAADLLIRSEHEVVDEELPAAFEEVEKRGISVRSLEPVGLLDQRHRLAAALRGEGVALPRQRLLLREDPFVR